MNPSWPTGWEPKILLNWYPSGPISSSLSELQEAGWLSKPWGLSVCTCPFLWAEHLPAPWRAGPHHPREKEPYTRLVENRMLRQAVFPRWRLTVITDGFPVASLTNPVSSAASEATARNQLKTFPSLEKQRLGLPKVENLYPAWQRRLCMPGALLCTSGLFC